MQYCSNCGAEVRQDSSYCPECNALVEQEGQQGANRQQRGGRGRREGGGRGQQQRGGQRGQANGGQQQYGGRQTDSYGGTPGSKGYPRAPTRDDTDVIGARIGAQIVDSIIGAVLFVVIVAVFGGVGASAGGESGAGIFGIGFLIGVAAVVFYFFLLEGFWDGQTLGKKLFGIKVVKDTGEECTIAASIIRNLLRIIDGLFYYVIGFIVMAATDKRQRLGDLAGGTVVVRENPNR
jgi:uncharacterized RDD family membrane protein YckC